MHNTSGLHLPSAIFLGKIKKLLLFFLLLPFIGFSQNQEVSTFVSYNTLNYRNETSFCTNNNNNPIAKEGYMKTIFGYLKPDLVACNEVGSNASNAAKILDRCLNVNGETKYVMAPFNVSSGSSLANAFYYNGEMFALKSNDQVTKEINGTTNIVRLIDVFTLYYKDANLPLNSDTTFLTIFIAHFKAGNSSANAGQRGRAAEAVMQYIEDNNITNNFIISGDFNTYKSSEDAIQNLINPTNSQEVFFDPINKLGNWNNNAAFADVHTQSTHFSSNGCASGGGLDDRFDWVMISQAIKNNDNRIEYVKNSYQAVANDGLHFNQSINNPANNSVPANVLDAIFNGSDHLPVVMDMIITEADPNGIDNVKPTAFTVTIPNPVTENITGEISGKPGTYTVTVYSITGSVLAKKQYRNKDKTNFDIVVNITGMLLIEVSDEAGFRQIFKVIRN